MSTYPTATVLRRLQAHRPSSAQEVLDTCKLPLLHLGSGAFRDVYLVVGTDLVIKIPRRSRERLKRLANIDHAKDEYTIWRRVRRFPQKYKGVHKYLPQILYYSSKTGLIVMRKYEAVRCSKEVNNLIRHLEADICTTMKVKDADIHYGNLGRDANGDIKITDMGLFITGSVNGHFKVIG